MPENGGGVMVARAVFVDPEYEEFLANLGLFLDSNAINATPREDQNLGFDGQITLVEEETDPQYKLFLENVREDGHRYVWEMEKKDGTMDFIKYGGGGGQLMALEEEAYRGPENGERKRDAAVLATPKTEPEDFVEDEHHGKIVKFKDENLAIGTNFDGLGKKLKIHQNMSKGNSDVVEVLGDGVEVDPQQMLKQKLKQVLRKPFDDKEFQKKLKAAKTRKLMERTRITRGRIVSYPTEERSPSYLDLHPDLASMLKNAREKQHTEKALALLRCLFFYYENIADEGSFIPWKRPPVWLHRKICSCPDNLNCHIRNRKSLGKRPCF